MSRSVDHEEPILHARGAAESAETLPTAALEPMEEKEEQERKKNMRLRYARGQRRDGTGN